jgi:gluconokinase
MMKKGSVVIMGVAGSGKSSLAAALAAALRWPLIEGDDFHLSDSRAKMRQGIALADADRLQWLVRLGHELAQHPHAVLACSALRRAYRDQLRAASPGLRFVFLQIEPDAARRRVAAREAEHLFPASLVGSQFDALEPPLGEDGVLTLDATQAPPLLAERALQWMDAAR